MGVMGAGALPMMLAKYTQLHLCSSHEYYSYLLVYPDTNIINFCQLNQCCFIFPILKVMGNIKHVKYKIPSQCKCSGENESEQIETV